MKKTWTKIVVTGLIMPNNWDKHGGVAGIALYTNTEEVYEVERNSLTEEMMNLVHRRVEINGEISENPNGKKSIEARTFTILDESVFDE